VIPVQILVVDDHPENRTALRAILSAQDYQIVEAGSGAEALFRLLEGDFAVPHRCGDARHERLRARSGH
jgi:CheY-like chemotaxis protein